MAREVLTCGCEFEGTRQVSSCGPWHKVEPAPTSEEMVRELARVIGREWIDDTLRGYMSAMPQDVVDERVKELLAAGWRKGI